MTTDYLIDTHCHLDLFKGIQHSVSQENDLPIKTISVTNSPAFFEPNLKLFSESKNIKIALGLHPELVKRSHNEIGLFEKHISYTKYIGEIGLDGSKEFSDTYELQTKTLNTILSIIKSAPARQPS